MNEVSDLDLALMEIGLEFGRACPAPLDPEARHKLVGAFHASIGPDILTGTISWNDAADRDFVLSKVREFAEYACVRVGSSGGEVTAAVVKDVALSRVPVWRDECDRPEIKEPLGPPCPALLVFFGALI